jgi:hypothetical protein
MREGRKETKLTLSRARAPSHLLTRTPSPSTPRRRHIQAGAVPAGGLPHGRAKGMEREMERESTRLLTPPLVIHPSIHHSSKHLSSLISLIPPPFSL